MVNGGDARGAFCATPMSARNSKINANETVLLPRIKIAISLINVRSHENYRSFARKESPSFPLAIRWRDIKEPSPHRVIHRRHHSRGKDQDCAGQKENFIFSFSVIYESHRSSVVLRLGKAVSRCSRA